MLNLLSRAVRVVDGSELEPVDLEVVEREEEIEREESAGSRGVESFERNMLRV